jgi:hypothetical protein
MFYNMLVEEFLKLIIMHANNKNLELLAPEGVCLFD